MAARKFTTLIFITIVGCCLGIVVCGVALGTDFWFHGSAKTPTGNSKVELKYGLFKGGRSVALNNTQQDDLKIVCMDGLCMYSCGITKEFRENEMKNARRSGQYSSSICSTGVPSGTISETVKDSDFLNFGLWLTTILFLAFAITFFALGAGLALYNTFRAPIQPILSVFGLYIWNGVAAGFVLLALIIWGITFTNTLKKNPNISETLNGNFKADIKGSLGFSYWVLLLAELLPLINIGILRYRSWKIAQLDKVHHQVIDNTKTSGDVLLF